MDILEKPAEGMYRVLTLSGACYLLDLDRNEMVRTKQAGGVTVFDGEKVPLVEVIDCRVDKPLRIVVQLLVPGIVHVRWTSTPVVRIEEVSAP